jgi:Ca2+-binding RTX toxin-like protein
MAVFTISPDETSVAIPSGIYDAITIVANGIFGNFVSLSGDVSVSKFSVKPGSFAVRMYLEKHRLGGTSGDDTFDFAGVRATGNAEAINLFAGDDIFRAGIEGVWVDGGSGNDLLFGGNGYDKLLGGAGNDRLYADSGVGPNELSGGTGTDYFIAAKRVSDGNNNSNNTITDFAPGVDKIDISAYGVSSFRQLQYILETNWEGYAYFDANIGGSSNNFTIEGVSKGRLSAGDFVFYTGSARELVGTDSSDRLFAASRGSILKGGLGENELFGGNGADVFVAPTPKLVSPRERNANTVFDFVAGVDRVDVSAFGITNFKQLSYILVKTLKGTYFEAGSHSFESSFMLNGVGVDQLLARDFIFYTGNVTEILGGSGRDHLFAGSKGAVLKGLAGNDVLVGGDGNDRLDGGKGDDDFYGGHGDDVYIVDSAQDMIVEASGEGVDLVISYSDTGVKLADNIENLIMRGDSDGDYGEGNDLANVITGSSHANRLVGYGGNDTLIGGGGRDDLEGGTGDDTLNGGTGTDTMWGGEGDDIYIVDEKYDSVIENGQEGVDLVKASCSYTLWWGVENLTLTGAGDTNGTGNDDSNTIIGNSGNNILTGNKGNDILIGGSGNDTLDGGSGVDRMGGGGGNDIYVVDDRKDRVLESTGAGTDLVKASVSYTLATNVENLALMGSGDMNGVGNALANVITGSVGKNLLKGMEGDDTLIGGRGADSLYGGTGKDTFVFSTLRDSTVSETGRDTIFGFSQTERDRIDLSGIDAKAPSTTNDAFTFVGTKDFSKKAGELRFEKTATDTYIYGDVDGNGRADFAIHLNAAVTLVKGDFIL